MKKANKKFELIKGYPLHPEGTTEASMSAIEYLENFKTIVKGKERYADVVEIEFTTKHGKLHHRYFPVLEEDTELGKLVKAINDGQIPERIKDPEEFFVGKGIMIKVKHNTSEKTGRTFANVDSVFPLEEDVDSDEEYEDDNEFDELDETNIENGYDDTEEDEDIDDFEDVYDDEDDATDNDFSDLDDDEEIGEEAPSKQPRKHKSSNWTNKSYDDLSDDFTD